ncbi:MAG: ABC-2 type transport system ATP-binding protein [Paraglaciecola sp.]|jgi:ABC-2 type transport system ATP-binding protein
MVTMKSESESESKDVIATLRNVSKSYSGSLALNNISLDIKRGEVLAILGANGAGKTTLINVMLGRLAIQAGEVQLFSSEPGSIAVKRNTGAMLQVASFPETLKIKEHIQLFQSYYPCPMDYQQVLAYSGLENMQNRYSRKLSGGEKQRLLFALSICGNPKLLFLDEPSAGMDLESRQRLWQAVGDLKKAGASIVLTTHYMQEAEHLADRILVLNQGQIVKQGSSEEIKASVDHKILRFISKVKSQVLCKLPDVVNVEISGKYSIVQSRHPVNTLHALFKLTLDIYDLSISGADLEDAIIQLNASQLNRKAVGE